MASGMEMMLKSFGFDPEKMRADIARYAQIIVEMDNRQARLEQMILTLTASVNLLIGRDMRRMQTQLDTLNTQLSRETPAERQHDDTGIASRT